MQTTTTLSIIDLYLCLNRIYQGFEYTHKVQDKDKIKTALIVVCNRALYIESKRGAE